MILNLYEHNDIVSKYLAKFVINIKQNRQIHNEWRLLNTSLDITKKKKRKNKDLNNMISKFDLIDVFRRVNQTIVTIAQYTLFLSKC